MFEGVAHFIIDDLNFIKNLPWLVFYPANETVAVTVVFLDYIPIFEQVKFYVRDRLFFENRSELIVPLNGTN
jgi:hypothetical protein